VSVAGYLSFSFATLPAGTASEFAEAFALPSSSWRVISACSPSSAYPAIGKQIAGQILALVRHDSPTPPLNVVEQLFVVLFDVLCILNKLDHGLQHLFLRQNFLVDCVCFLAILLIITIAIAIAIAAIAWFLHQDRTCECAKT